LHEWEKAGHRIVRQADPDNLPAADALFVHVDLSVLPAAYRNLAGKFPRAINADIVDIRKRSLSLNQVVPGDGYAGPVIIKSSLNAGGAPEQRAANTFARTAFRLRHKWRSLLGKWSEALSFPSRSPTIKSKANYLVLPAAKDVPASWFADTDLVIERFTPETHNGLFVLREWYFLGTAESRRVETARYPVITSGEYRPDLFREIPANLRQLRRQWKIDYGKIDYVMQEDGSAFVFDVNKTPTLTRPPQVESARQLIVDLASGIDSFLS
jgi:hypothetical protein